MTARTSEGMLVGLCFMTKFQFLDGIGFWITQLVVHSDFRHKGIAKKLCSFARDDSALAWGIVSCHPFAIRALEKGIGKNCDLKRISQYAESIIKAAKVPYVELSMLRISDSKCKCAVDTQFYVDHYEVDRLASSEPDWKFGNLDQAEEYFAFIFR